MVYCHQLTGLTALHKKVITLNRQPQNTNTHLLATVLRCLCTLLPRQRERGRGPEEGGAAEERLGQRCPTCGPLGRLEQRAQPGARAQVGGLGLGRGRRGPLLQRGAGGQVLVEELWGKGPPEAHLFLLPLQGGVCLRRTRCRGRHVSVLVTHAHRHREGP